MKIYIATKFQNVEGFNYMRSLLHEKGHRIIHDWTQENAETVQEDRRKCYLEDCALADFDGASKADLLILLAHEKINGALVELGIALGSEIPVVVVGANEPSIPTNIFYHLPEGMMRHAPTPEAAVEIVEAYRNQLENDKLGGLGALLKAISNHTVSEPNPSPDS